MHRWTRWMPAAGLLALAVAAGAADFYEGQMRAGEQALAAGRAAESIDALRVASFGLLEKPALLSECLAALAVAQNRAHRAAEADATLQRFQAVQALYPAQTSLSSASAPVRAEFEAFARRRIPGFTLGAPDGNRQARREAPESR